MVAKGIQNVVSYRVPWRARRDQLRPMDFLLRLLYVIEKSGDWAGWEAIVRMAKHRGLMGRLPIELTSADVEGVGSRAVVDGRCEALRQLSLIGRHLGVALQRDNKGEERLNGRLLTIHTLHTLPADHPFRDRYDPANPVCEFDGFAFASIRDAVLYEMRYRGSEVADQYVYQHLDAPRHNRLRELAHQQPPVWKCGTISTNHYAAGDRARVIVLHGDQPQHTFEAHLYIFGGSTFSHARLYTTERPVAGRMGAARFPQTVRVVREVMGADAQGAFGNQLAVAVD
ncbi:unnamed protein product [Vitrella brassicaformis CCMP3155]|uniref:Uncharacterized protein n=2 Tax=Vitrella brassicaformis TaxID=1169539 RepID=A0A0G4EU94_VITBC|nr:unnamed protein product [Vitrella brassicaformis CCMP3155]|eukprot:CEM01660.1 unnamed protein product [Vitrella brassicaformis CCMP3155]